jgi:N-methylhydantoinase B
VETIVKDGTVLAPEYPVTSAGQGPTVGTSVYEVCQLALNQAVPKENNIAIWQRLMSPHMAGKLREAGIDQRTKQTKVYYAQTFAGCGGTGAVWGHDGGNWPGGPQSGRGSTRAPIESTEVEIPYRWLQQELVTDSGGDGKWRGGLGVHLEVLNLHERETWEPLDCILETGSSDSSKFPPPGVLGGTAGTRSRMWIKRDSEEVPLRTVDTMYAEPGDIIVVNSGGGGGVGNPHDRDIEKVRDDVINEYISIEKARDVYGVAMDPETFHVDQDATDKLRGK